MLKTVSSITNAIGALNYKGTWNASTNSPALASGVGTKGDYYVVSVAGSTNLDGETLWGVGDWAVYNGAAWQKVEGGNTINATTVSASTSVTTPVIQATSSAGGTLKNNGGTAQLQWGSGGGSNLSLEVATNINPANAAVAISPTGTGTVTINPATASTMNNVAIGGTTPLAGTFTTVIAKGATSGQTTIQATDAVTAVITLPSSTSTLISTTSSGQSIPKAALPTGSVLQVVSSSPYTTVQSTSTAAYSSTGVVANITPTSATSKILIKYTGQAYIDRNAGEALLAIYKNSVFLVGGYAIYSASAGFITTSANIEYLDSPATTSAIEYRLYIKSNNGVASVGINPNNSTDIPSVITLMEIAA